MKTLGAYSFNTLKKLLARSNQMPAQQSTKLVKSYRDEADKLFESKKYREALVFYNKSLSYAVAGSADAAELFASRSAVYLEIKYYQKCIENIRLSRASSNFTLEKKLLDREVYCEKLLKSDKAILDVQSFSKLSYPAHDRVPYIANCLELGDSTKFGRFIFSNQNLKPGEVIAIEEPFFKFVDLQTRHFYKYQRCFNCFKSNQLSLLPGPHSGKENRNLFLFSAWIVLTYLFNSDVLLTSMSRCNCCQKC